MFTALFKGGGGADDAQCREVEEVTDETEFSLYLRQRRNPECAHTDIITSEYSYVQGWTSRCRRGEATSSPEIDDLWCFDRLNAAPPHSLSGLEGPLQAAMLREYSMCCAVMHPAAVQRHIVDTFFSSSASSHYSDAQAIFARYNDARKALDAEVQAVEDSSLDGRSSYSEAVKASFVLRLSKYQKQCRMIQSSNHLPSFLGRLIDVGIYPHPTPQRYEITAWFDVDRCLPWFYGHVTRKVLPLEECTMRELLALATIVDEEAATATVVTSVHTQAVVGVSLRFLKDFAASRAITEDMTSGEVVRRFIIPETIDSQDTYLNSKLLSRPYYASDLRQGYAKMNRLVPCLDDHDCKRTQGMRAFLSHAWSMPYLELVRIAENAARVDSARKDGISRGTDAVSNEVEDSTFFWVDIFCKNQHVPTPAMHEFDQAISAPDSVVVALSPESPVALSRVWCLFEIWSAVSRGKRLTPTFSEEAFSNLSSLARENFQARRAQPCGDLMESVGEDQSKIIARRKAVSAEIKTSFIAEMRLRLNISIQDATATMQQDVDTILALVRDSVGIDELNETVFQSIYEQLWVRVELEFGYSRHIHSLCFDGEGSVQMADGTCKPVREILAGDEVKTHDGARARVALVTKDKTPPHGVLLCDIQGVLLTPEHPILHRGTWVTAMTVSKPFISTSITYIYNFELFEGSSVVIDGVSAMTLGQTIGFDVDSDALFGHGWAHNPCRAVYMERQQQRLLCV